MRVFLVIGPFWSDGQQHANGSSQSQHEAFHRRTGPPMAAVLRTHISGLGTCNIHILIECNMWMLRIRYGVIENDRPAKLTTTIIIVVIIISIRVRSLHLIFFTVRLSTQRSGIFGHRSLGTPSAAQGRQSVSDHADLVVSTNHVFSFYLSPHKTVRVSSKADFFCSL